MNILITGKNGYIANAIKNNLPKDKYNIYSIGRDNFDLTSSHQTNKFFTNKYYDVVIHTAISGGSRLVEDDYNVVDTNLRMYYNLLENKTHFGKLINIGSGAELLSVDTPYGLSKNIIYNSVLNTDDFYNLRVYAVFDENELDRRFIKSAITNYINKKDINIFDDRYMDLFYMKDLINVIKYYIDNTNIPKEVNCVYEHKYKLSEIANIINDLSDYNVSVNILNEDSKKNYIGEFNLPSKIKLRNIVDCISETYNKLIDKVVVDE